MRVVLLVLLVLMIVPPLGSAADGEVLIVSRPGGGWSSFRLDSPTGELRFEIDSQAIGAASYGANVVDATGAVIVSLRATGPEGGDGASVGALEWGATAVAPQAFVSGGWILSFSQQDAGCNGAGSGGISPIPSTTISSSRSRVAAR